MFDNMTILKSPLSIKSSQDIQETVLWTVWKLGVYIYMQHYQCNAMRNYSALSCRCNDVYLFRL